jgi:nucleotide-binding universal stress UspA family protein
MPAPHTILAAVDFGDASARAVEAAGMIAQRCRVATFRLLHAESMEAPAYFTSEQVARLEQQRRAMHTQAEQFLSTFGRRHTRVPFATVVDALPPADAILRESAGADLIVMGTHGRRGPERWWLGSVAERVLRASTRPLLVLKASASPDRLFDRILVDARPPLSGDRALQYARDFAACFGGQIVDGRHDPIETTIARARATLVVAAIPEPHSAALSHDREGLLRFSDVPILFVPETVQGATT